MTINKNNIGSQLDKILRPMGITRNLRSYHLICACIVRIFEQEDRLGAVQKEIYMPIAEADRCDWTGIQSAIRRAAQTAWHNCPDTVILTTKTAFGKCRRLFLNNSKLYHFTLISSASCG